MEPAATSWRFLELAAARTLEPARAKLRARPGKSFARPGGSLRLWSRIRDQRQPERSSQAWVDLEKIWLTWANQIAPDLVGQPALIFLSATQASSPCDRGYLDLCGSERFVPKSRLTDFDKISLPAKFWPLGFSRSGPLVRSPARGQTISGQPRGPTMTRHLPRGPMIPPTPPGDQ